MVLFLETSPLCSASAAVMMRLCGSPISLATSRTSSHPRRYTSVIVSLFTALPNLPINTPAPSPRLGRSQSHDRCRAWR
ncbi:hypothetical protein J3F83DRAFT_744147 [Trichoderma novae-zelandiae]